jgi:hypothetical protein
MWIQPQKYPENATDSEIGFVGHDNTKIPRGKMMEQKNNTERMGSKVIKVSQSPSNTETPSSTTIISYSYIYNNSSLYHQLGFSNGQNGQIR